MNGRLTLARSETGGSRFNVESARLGEGDDGLLQAEADQHGTSATSDDASVTGPLSAHVLLSMTTRPIAVCWQRC